MSDAGASPDPRASTPLTGVALPLGVIWAGVLFSAFVYSKLPRDLGIEPRQLFASFGATPLLSLLAFGALRLIRRQLGPMRRSEDLVVAWTMLFLLAVHCLVLALALGVVSSFARGLPFVTALLFVGLGPTTAALEPGSLMGIRTAATLASPEAWRRTHRLAGIALPVGGLSGLFALALDGVWTLVGAVLPGLVALAIVIAHGALLAPEPPPPPGTDR